MSEFKLINRRLDTIEKNQDRILYSLHELSMAIAGHKPDQWIDSPEVMNMLRISRTTLYRETKKGHLVFSRIGGRLYYYRPDIFKLKDKFLK